MSFDNRYSTFGPGPLPSQYAPAAHVPLIKAPSLYLPKPITLPMDIHPLPPDISAYFVYPFTLEPHILAQNADNSDGSQGSVHSRIHEQRIAYQRIIDERKEAAERKKKEELRRVAPGWNPEQGGVGGGGGVLKPTVSASAAAPVDASASAGIVQSTSNQMDSDGGVASPNGDKSNLNADEQAFRTLTI